VLQAQKDFNLEKHPEIDVSNLKVIKLMQSFKSRELVTERFAWRHYYWCAGAAAARAWGAIRAMRRRASCWGHAAGTRGDHVKAQLRWCAEVRCRSGSHQGCCARGPTPGAGPPWCAGS
jgi:hypothetical protein